MERYTGGSEAEVSLLGPSTLYGDYGVTARGRLPPLAIAREAGGIRRAVVEGRRFKVIGTGLPQSLPAIVGYGSCAAMAASLQCLERKTGRLRRRLPPLAVFGLDETIIGLVKSRHVGKRAPLAHSGPGAAMAAWRRHGEAAAVVAPRPRSFRASLARLPARTRRLPAALDAKSGRFPFGPLSGAPALFGQAGAGPAGGVDMGSCRMQAFPSGVPGLSDNGGGRIRADAFGHGPKPARRVRIAAPRLCCGATLPECCFDRVSQRSHSA